MARYMTDTEKFQVIKDKVMEFERDYLNMAKYFEEFAKETGSEYCSDTLDFMKTLEVISKLTRA